MSKYTRKDDKENPQISDLFCCRFVWRFVLLSLFRGEKLTKRKYYKRINNLSPEITKNTMLTEGNLELTSILQYSRILNVRYISLLIRHTIWIFYIYMYRGLYGIEGDYFGTLQFTSPVRIDSTGNITNSNVHVYISK